MELYTIYGRLADAPGTRYRWRSHTLPVLKFIGQLCHEDHVGGLDRLLLEKSNAKGIVGVIFGVFKMWDGEFGIVNCNRSASSPVAIQRSAQHSQA